MSKSKEQIKKIERSRFLPDKRKEEYKERLRRIKEEQKGIADQIAVNITDYDLNVHKFSFYNS